MNLNDEYIVDILRQNNEGFGICKVNNFIVFVPYALPNEKVKIKIDLVNRNYATGQIIEIIEESNDRIKPICPYFYECGGCDLMHQHLDGQLEFKRNKIKSIFKKICNKNIEINKINNYNNLNYRNKASFKVKNNKIGFYKNKTNEIIDIEECKICDKKINEVLKLIRKFINENINNDISNIVIRVCNNEVMISLDKINENIREEFINYIKEYVSSIYINNDLVYGEKSLIQNINDLKFNVSLKSFFQVNIKTAEKLYESAVKNVENDNVTIDLYSGTGTITSLLAKKSKKVVGIEVIKDAVKDANKNMILNNIDNVTFLCGKVENLIDKVKKLNIDTIVLDPPRSGSDKKTLKAIKEMNPKKIIYISCNPVTLARDINYLDDMYNIENLDAYDMFPNTHHVESLCILNKRD